MSRLANLFLRDPPPAEPEATASGPAAAKGPRYTLLFVDDELNVLKSLRRIFRKENYEILTAADGEQALRYFENSRRIHLVVSDHRMPGLTGAEVLRRVKETSPDTIRIMLTGHADVHAVMGAINEGAVYKFVTKPWNDDDLRVTVSLALEQYDLIQENRRLKVEGKAKEKELRSLRRLADVNRSQVGRFLAKDGRIAPADLERAKRAQQQTGENFVRTLVRLKLAQEDELQKLILREIRVDTVALAEWNIPREVLSLLPRKLCEDAGVLPLRVEGKRLLLAMADPTDLCQANDLAFAAGLEVVPVLVRDSELRARLAELWGEHDELATVADLVAVYDPLDTVEVVLEDDDEEDVQSLLGGKDQPPAIRIVNAILAEAVRLGASDVHIEPRTKHVAVRYRIDGLLTDKIQVPPQIHTAVVSRLKILADLDIAERRRPQDGRITVKTSRKIVDLRISTLPTISGEKVVLRILDRNAAVRRLSDLGLSPRATAILSRLARAPQGIFLTTGPTGSGKTTTLYALLAEAFDPKKNYVTIEDPVEYYLEQAGQVHVREKIGLNFATVLRSVLRQDPNVILLGEIRDLETAQVAFHAALTGHLVLSTLHTNSASATVVRLRDLGLDPTVTTSALTGILAQRLVRTLCPACTEWKDPGAAVLRDLDLEGRWEGPAPAGRGCPECQGAGYRGRVAVIEILEMNDALREAIRGGAGGREIQRLSRMSGANTLLEDGLAKVAEGITSLPELLRVLGPQMNPRRPCPGCGKPADAGHRVCPFCGVTLLRVCTGCGKPLEEGWHHCPACGDPNGERP